MRRGSARVFLTRTLILAIGSALSSFAALDSAEAVSKEVWHPVRDAYEGRSMRLRVDLRSAGQAIEPNVMTLEGIGYGRENTPFLFSRMERVYLERVTSEGATRLGLTVYRSEEEMRRLRASFIPAPASGMPGATQTMAVYATTGSTTVILELRAGKKDPDAQRGEIGALLVRLFYTEGEPSREEMERFVVERRAIPVSQLSQITGLSKDAIREILSSAEPAQAN